MPFSAETRASPQIPRARRATNSANQSAQRIHYLDNLRALAMLSGVFLHAAFAYAHPAQTFWLATDPQSSVALDAAIWFLHLFRMALFFFIAGYFAKLLVARIGMRRMLVQRAVRLLIPFVVFYPFLLATMTVLIVFGLSYVDEPRGLLGLIATTAPQSAGPSNRPPPGTMHLWFLYYLIFFTLIGAVLSRFTIPKVTPVFRNRWIMAVAPLILLPGVIGAGVPIPAPESFVPAGWPFAFYGPFYWAGWQWFGREQSLEPFRPYVWHIVVASVMLFIPYYWSLPVLDLTSLLQNPQPLPFGQQVISWILTAYLAAGLTLASLLLGQRFLAGRDAKLKFIADSSYWVYLVHLPVVLFLQLITVPLGWNLWLKLLVTLFGTMAFCLATYVVFVRYTPVGAILHGKRSFP